MLPSVDTTNSFPSTLKRRIVGFFNCYVCRCSSFALTRGIKNVYSWPFHSSTIVSSGDTCRDFVDVWNPRSHYRGTIIKHARTHARTMAILCFTELLPASFPLSPPPPSSRFNQAWRERSSQQHHKRGFEMGDRTLPADPCELTPTAHYSPAGLGADCKCRPGSSACRLWEEGGGRSVSFD